jgi:PAS domain S-box-containing protein
MEMTETYMGKIRLLYIEDDEAQREESTELLRKRGYDVSAARDGNTGLEILGQITFDAVLCDLNMPGMNGLEVLRQAKKIAPDTPFLILTAHGSMPLAVETTREGAVNFVLKPFEIEVLEITIHQSIEMARLQRKLRESNTELDSKAKQLEAKTMELAQANVDLLGAQEQIEEHRDVLQAIIDSSPSALIMVNHEGKITAASILITDFFDLEIDTILGMEFDQFHGRIGPLFENSEAFENLTTRLCNEPDLRESGTPGMADLQNRTIRLVKPKPRMIATICKPVLDRAGEELGRVWIYVDVTEEIRSNEQIRLIVESSPIPTIISRLEDGKIIFVNEQLGEMSGYRKEEMIGKCTPDFYYDREQREAVVEMLKRDGYLRDYEVRIRTSDGGFVWAVLSLTVTELGGEPVIIGGLADVTERKRAEEELKRERNFVSAVLDTAGALVVVLDPEGHILRCNRACEKITGYKFPEIRDKHFVDVFILPEETETVKERFEQILREKRFVQGDNYWRAKDGSSRLITWSNTVLLDDSCEVEYVIATGIDVTKRKEAEEKLRLYKEIFLNSKDGILIVDPKGDFIEANQTYSELYGYSPEELRNMNACDVVGPEMEEKLHTALTTGGSFRGALTSTTKDGEERTVDVSAYPIRNEAGDVSCYISVERDITERKQAQDALSLRLQYEEELATISQELLTGAEAVDALDRTVNRLLTVSGVSRVRIIENFEHPEDGLCMRQTHGACTPDLKSLLSNPLLQHIRYDDGFERWNDMLSQNEEIRGKIESFPESERKILSSFDILSVLAIPIQVEGKWYGFVELDDCKEAVEWSDENTRLLRTAAEIIGTYIGHERFEQALRVSEERFRSLVENATDVIFSLSPEGNFTYLSPQFTETTGFAVSEFIGQPVTALMPPDDAQQSLSWIINGMPKDHEHSGGYQFRMKTKAGEWRWFTSDSSVIRNDKGEIIEAIGVAHDITEVKQMLEDLETANRELRDTQTQLVQSEKMASLGQLVAGIAHEINTPVGAVGSMHDTQVRAMDKLRKTLESEFPDEYKQSETVKACFETIENANKVIETGTERVTTIVRRLRSFARLDEADLKTVDIHEGLEDTLTLIHHEIKHHITVTKDYGDIPPIACYPGRVNQVFLNILNNARQAVGEKGEVRIRTYQRDGNVCVEISDNGVGISKVHLARVFDPGFTTKGVGVGTGLGLSICYQIIQDHRGDIEVESEPGKGTTFRIVLPIGLDKMIENNG